MKKQDRISVVLLVIAVVAFAVGRFGQAYLDQNAAQPEIFEGGEWHIDENSGVWITETTFAGEKVNVEAYFNDKVVLTTAFIVLNPGKFEYRIKQDGTFLVRTPEGDVAADGDEVAELQGIYEKYMPLYPKLKEYWQSHK